MTDKTSLILSILMYVLSLPSAATGALFQIVESGTQANHVSITLCLNGKGPVSCQIYSLSYLNLTITPNISHHAYPFIGIKANSPGYTLTGCTEYGNGYCLFSASEDSPKNIVLSPLSYELITIGNPGNANDETTGYGSVSYSYRIGKYHVTIQQYTAFLNAIAKTDTYNVYNPLMSTDLNSAGIARMGASGQYTYAVMDNGGSSANRPVTYVSWFNAARFANWMANGQPTGAQNSTSTENGAYALNGTTSGLAVAKNNINPNTGAPPIFYIPLENEWYKAAYYNPDTETYVTFATQSNTAPGNTIGDAFNQANYFIANGSGFAVTQSLYFASNTQNYLTDVGSFTASSSFYGTFDQNGNADQWNDLDGTTSLYRGLRGGFYFAGSSPLQSTLFAKSIASNAYNGGGFRLASPALTN